MDECQPLKWGQPPINLDFQVPMFTASGLRIRFLKVGLRVSQLTPASSVCLLIVHAHL